MWKTTQEIHRLELHPPEWVSLAHFIESFEMVVKGFLLMFVQRTVVPDTVETIANSACSFTTTSTSSKFDTSVQLKPLSQSVLYVFYL